MRKNTDQKNFEYGHFLRSVQVRDLLSKSSQTLDNIKATFKKANNTLRRKNLELLYM